MPTHLRTLTRLTRALPQGRPQAARFYATAALGHNPNVNSQRLWDDIHHTSQWGTGKRWGDRPYETGMNRLTLTDSDKQARDWFVETTKSLGCTVKVDTVGNTFAVRPGRHQTSPPICMGSHLDTQPTGGRYDGVLGVCAGIEALRTLKDHQIETEYPIGVINWTNEEGSRYPLSMMGSGVWSGHLKLEDVYKLVEVGEGGRKLKDELVRIGYLGSTPASFEANPIAAHFELHIEQGPRLENASQKIGVVSGVQSYEWLEVTVIGREAHTGTTPFDSRADAMLAAANIICESHTIAKSHGALASTGIIKAMPGSVNTIPGLVKFSLDIRASTDSVRKRVVSEVRTACASLQENRSGLTLQMNSTFESAAVHFNDECIRCVRESATSRVGNGQADLVSGAGHDSVFTSRHAPTTMIFVPCRNGVSHHPEEFCSQEDCAIGAQVLLDSVLKFDQLRAFRQN